MLSDAHYAGCRGPLKTIEDANVPGESDSVMMRLLQNMSITGPRSRVSHIPWSSECQVMIIFIQGRNCIFCYGLTNYDHKVLKHIIQFPVKISCFEPNGIVHAQKTVYRFQIFGFEIIHNRGF